MWTAWIQSPQMRPSLEAGRHSLRPGDFLHMAYVLNTDDDVRVMLETIGIGSIDELFEVVPPEFRLGRPLDVPEALGEMALTQHMAALAAKNQGVDDRPCFLGGGCYDHFI